MKWTHAHGDVFLEHGPGAAYKRPRLPWGCRRLAVAPRAGAHVLGRSWKAEGSVAPWTARRPHTYTDRYTRRAHDGTLPAVSSKKSAQEIGTVVSSVAPISLARTRLASRRGSAGGYWLGRVSVCVYPYPPYWRLWDGDTSSRFFIC